ncbi:hypothetical protein V7S43_012480 [Phytophthora oleae]|uniref:Uncharacterized protein n=1 Tax=Phytophthora oleae TaxID=2107226 RepID=A0ABD3FC83_9STRA
MIEFTGWEVYAYEDSSNANTFASQDGLVNGRPSSKPESQQDQYSLFSSNRIDRVVQANSLPQISDKALAFESYHVHTEKGIFGGRHDGAIMHWSISPTPSVTIPSVRYCSLLWFNPMF